MHALPCRFWQRSSCVQALFAGPHRTKHLRRLPLVCAWCLALVSTVDGQWCQRQCTDVHSGNIAKLPLDATSIDRGIDLGGVL